MNSGSIFLALVPANTSNSGIFNTPDLPLDFTLSDALYHTAFTGPATNADVAAATSFVLPAGTYDLIAGSGAFGTSGEGFVTEGETLIGSPTLVVGEPAFQLGGSGSQETFYSQAGNYNFTGRFFVAGVPAVPEASTPVSLGVMLGLGGLALVGPASAQGGRGVEVTRG